jgi:hypothetical protein
VLPKRSWTVISRPEASRNTIRPSFSMRHPVFSRTIVAYQHSLALEAVTSTSTHDQLPALWLLLPPGNSIRSNRLQVRVCRRLLTMVRVLEDAAELDGAASRYHIPPSGAQQRR